LASAEKKKGFSANGKKPEKYTEEIREQARVYSGDAARIPYCLIRSLSFYELRISIRTRNERAKHAAELLGVGTDEM
jgi:hypothetical protein